MTKTCSKCGEDKPLSKFNKDYRRNGRLLSWCKACKSEYNHKYRTEYKEQIRERGCTQRANHRLQQRYGITIAKYDEKLEAQGGGCAICGATPEENGKRLNVDHDHETGAVRGLLCGSCNRAIGLFQDDPNIMRSAVNYMVLWAQNQVLLSRIEQLEAK